MIDASFYDEEYFTKGTKSGYGGQFSPYNENLYHNVMKPLAKKLTASYHPKNALDLGCARGYLVRALVEEGVDTQGIDVSTWAIQNCDPSVKDRVHVGTMVNLSQFQDNQFQLVTALDAFEHVEKSECLQAIAEACRVSDQHIMIRVPIHDNGKDPSHVNIQSIQWWIQQFKLHNFDPTYAMRLVQRDGNIEYEVIFERELIIVVCIPCYNSGKTLPILLKHLKVMKPNLVIFGENNSIDDTMQIIQDYDGPKELIRVWFRPDAIKFFKTEYDNIGHIRQLFLTRVRHLNPDYMLMLDSCVIPIDPLLILKMVTKRPDISGGVYYRHFPDGHKIATLFLDPQYGLAGPYIKHDVPPSPYGEVAGTSGGCMLISRKVFQDKRLNFMPIRFKLNEHVSEDFGYCFNANMLGYKTTLDATVEMIHIELGRHRPWTDTVAKGKDAFEFTQ